MRVGEQAGADSTHASPAAWRGRQALGAAAGNGRQERTKNDVQPKGYLLAARVSERVLACFFFDGGYILMF